LAGALLVASPAAAQDWDAVPDEPVQRTAEHYPETNEHAHQLYYPLVSGRGGGYLGVGSAQSYSIAAAQGAERMVLIDYDPVVTRLHRALAVLLASCEDAACLQGRLTPSAERASADAIARALGSDWSGRRTVRAFRVHRPLLSRRIRELSEIESWVSRDDWFTHIRDLARDGRIVARIADLRGSEALPAIAAAARSEGLEFRVIYLSNAEEYFSYGPQFVSNMSTLPHHEGTVILRTLRDRRLPRAPADSMWHYDSQPLDDLLARIQTHGYEDSSWLVADLLASERAARDDGTSVLDAATPAQARPSSRRWWLEASPPTRTRASSVRRESRLLLAVRRALLPTLDPVRRRTLRGVNLGESGLARMRNVSLPEGLVLSGEVSSSGAVEVPEPERNVEAMLLDAMAREVLPAIYARAGEADIAAALREAPPSNDLYAAYRLRERLLEICPPGTRAVGPLGEAVRACRHASRLVRPAPTARARLGWARRRALISRATRGVAREAVRTEAGADAMLALFTRLTSVAQSIQ